MGNEVVILRTIQVKGGGNGSKHRRKVQEWVMSWQGEMERGEEGREREVSSKEGGREGRMEGRDALGWDGCCRKTEERRSRTLALYLAQRVRFPILDGIGKRSIGGEDRDRRLMKSSSIDGSLSNLCLASSLKESAKPGLRGWSFLDERGTELCMT